jgi:predicted ATPase
MQKIPISGGPHTGKTTLVNALRDEFPDAYFVEEPAERVIGRELKKQQDEPGYTPIVPMSNYPAFVPLVIAEGLALEAAIPSSAEIVFQDRSLIDNIGYGALNNYDAAFSKLHRYITAARYSFALLCEPVGLYTATDIRHETAEQALKTHSHIALAYDTSGINVVHLPAVSVPERVEMVHRAIEENRSIS